MNGEHFDISVNFFGVYLYKTITCPSLMEMCSLQRVSNVVLGVKRMLKVLSRHMAND